jgi:hypothetical protein
VGGRLVMFRRRRLVRLHLRKDDSSFEGVLVDVIRGHYSLENARLILAAEQSRIVGNVWVQKADVLFLQVIE